MASIYFSNGNTLLPTTDKYIVRIFNLPAISIRDDHGNINKDCPNICLEAPGICKEIWIVNTFLDNFFKVIFPILYWCLITK